MTPKRFRDRIAALELRLALAWPGEPRPVPLFVGRGHEGCIGEKPLNAWVWRFTSYGVERQWLDLHGYQHDQEKDARPGMGSAARGAFFATQRAACLAAWWAECDRAADRIMAAQKAYEGVGE